VSAADDHPPYCECKVGESCWKAQLPGVPFEIGEYWGGDGDSDQKSIRELTEYLNRRFIKKFAEDAGVALIEGEAENYRRLLTADDVDEGTREEARGKLDREGVDVDSLEAALVTQPTVYRHMTTCLGLEHERPELSHDEAEQRIGGALDRLRNTVLATLRQLGYEEDVESASIGVNVVCAHCGDVYDVFQYLSRRGCRCDESD
jgi:DNA-binding transcriptional ArsR family regulator